MHAITTTKVKRFKNASANYTLILLISLMTMFIIYLLRPVGMFLCPSLMDHQTNHNVSQRIYKFVLSSADVKKQPWEFYNIAR